MLFCRISLLEDFAVRCASSSPADRVLVRLFCALVHYLPSLTEGDGEDALWASDCSNLSADAPPKGDPERPCTGSPHLLSHVPPPSRWDILYGRHKGR